MQMQNSIDCSGGPQQIALVQLDDDEKAVCSLNLRQHKTIVCIRVSYPLQKDHPLFLAKPPPPPLNRQTVQAVFLGNPLPILVLREPSLPPPKGRLFQ